MTKLLIYISVLLMLYFLIKHTQKMYITEFRLQNGKFLLLIAHPDDEIMFFTPLLQNMKEQITILCLSNGNYYEKGDVRQIEMQNVCDRINVSFIISSIFYDGHDWNAFEIASYLKNLHIINKFDAIFTFDKKGVSGHKNHISCFLGAQLFTKNNAVPMYLLKTQSLFEKYFIKYKFTDLNLITKEWLAGINTMLLYKSQMVWFRYLYLVTSNYMLYNEFIQYQ